MWGIWLFPCGLVIVWASRMVFVGKAWWGGWLIFLAGLIDGPLLVLLFLPGVSVALSVYLSLLIGWGWPGACFKLALDSREPQPASA